MFYAQTLGVPARVGVDDESVIAGEQLFDDIDRTACHTRRWETAIHEVESLSHQVIYPYTDVLLHDMGEVFLMDAPMALPRHRNGERHRYEASGLCAP